MTQHDEAYDLMLFTIKHMEDTLIELAIFFKDSEWGAGARKTLRDVIVLAESNRTH